MPRQPPSVEDLLVQAVLMLAQRNRWPAATQVEVRIETDTGHRFLTTLPLTVPIPMGRVTIDAEAPSSSASAPS